MKTHARFLDYVDTLDYMEVCRVVISREGEYSIPSEKDGRISLVSPTTRKALGNFLRKFAERLECPDPAHIKTPRSRPGARHDFPSRHVRK